MNSLSWMIYAASVADSIGTGLGIMFLISVFFAGVSLIAAMVIFTPPVKNDERVYAEKARRAGLRAAAAASVVFLIGSFIPSKTTIYMIAASELGARSETLAKAGGLVDPAIDLLRKKIDEALKEKP